MKRTRVKSVNRKRGGSSFPKQRDRKYCGWVIEEPCILEGRVTTRRLSTSDRMIAFAGPNAFAHVCWGPRDPMHVGEHRARGAPDFGVVVSGCRATHDFYDQHRSDWPRVTQISHREMARIASGLGLKYVEQGGISAPQGAKP